MTVFLMPKSLLSNDLSKIKKSTEAAVEDNDDANSSHSHSKSIIESEENTPPDEVDETAHETLSDHSEKTDSVCEKSENNEKPSNDRKMDEPSCTETELEIDVQVPAVIAPNEKAQELASKTTARELKDMCKAKHLNTSGKKLELAVRLIELESSLDDTVLVLT